MCVFCFHLESTLCLGLCVLLHTAGSHCPWPSVLPAHGHWAADCKGVATGSWRDAQVRFWAPVLSSIFPVWTLSHSCMLIMMSVKIDKRSLEFSLVTLESEIAIFLGPNLMFLHLFVVKQRWTSQVFLSLCRYIHYCLKLFTCYVFARSGGGLGDESIRKTAYFESSVDPSLLKNKVSICSGVIEAVTGDGCIAQW